MENSNNCLADRAVIDGAVTSQQASQVRIRATQAHEHLAAASALGTVPLNRTRACRYLLTRGRNS